MSTKYTPEEAVLNYIIKAVKGKPTNRTYINPSIVEELIFSESEIVQALYLLQSDDRIQIIKISPQNNLSMSCIVDLTSSGIHYFEQKREKIINAKNNQIQTWAPIILSTLALITSVITAALELGLISLTQ